MTRSGQTNNVTTSIVTPGRTCEYRTYMNNSASTSTGSTNTTHNVTVDIGYVYYDTYIGVYKYHTDSNTYELVREVGRNFSGLINTTMNDTTEIYVQMHPFSFLSCAGFDVYIDTEPGLFTQSAGSTQTSSGSGGTTESTERNSKGISGGILALIIIFSLLGAAALLFGSAFLIVYCEQRTKRPRNTPVRRITPTVEVASGTPEVVSGAPVTNNETNKKFYQIGSNTSDLNAFNNSHTNFSTSTPVSDNNVDEEERNEDLVLEEIPVGENST